jgi:glycine/D-amino acid oxidase-like deaminating enzyme
MSAKGIRQPFLSTTPYWWTDIGSAPNAGNVPGRRYDVVVVGGGYTGLAAARRLASEGAVVAVLEAEYLGYGASTRNGGMVSGTLKWSPETLSRRTDPVVCRAVYREAGETVLHLESLNEAEGIECAYSRCGMYIAAYTRRHLEAMEREQEELATVGIETHTLSPAAGLAELASDYYHGGRLVPLAGGLQPAALHRGLARAAAQHGVALFERCRVKSLERRSSGWTVVTERGGVEADQVIVATNGYSRGGPGPFAPRLIPVRSYVIATEELSRELVQSLIPRARMIQDSKNFLYYFRPSPDGTRIVFGGRASYGDIGLDESAKRLMHGLRRIFPDAMRDVRPAWSWNGLVAFTFDRLPHMGMEDGLHYALGYCGQGVAMSAYLGDRVAFAVLQPGREVSVFQRLPFRGRLGYRGDPWMLPLVGLGLKVRDFVDRYILR